MTWKSVLALLITLAIGGGLTFSGYNEMNSGEVSCAGQAMRRSDSCEETHNGSTTTRTYDEQKGQDQQGNYIAMGLGALIVVGAVFFTVAGARARRTAARTQAAG